MQKQGQAIEIWAVGMFCIFGWEWLLFLPTEVKRIWRPKMTAISVLYLANRYFGLLQFSIVISLTVGAWSPATCKNGYLWEPVGGIISTIISQVLLGSRVYALYDKNRIIGISLIVPLLVQLCVHAYATTTIRMPSAIPGVPTPCGTLTGPLGWLIAYWSMPLLYDTLAFFLTAWKTFELWKNQVTTPLLDVIWKDGILYFFVTFSMNFANVVIFLKAPKALRTINLGPTLMLNVILSCRMVLNLRDTHAGMQTWSIGYASQTQTPSLSRPNRSHLSTADKMIVRTPQSAAFNLSETSWVDLSSPPQPKPAPNRFVPEQANWQGDSAGSV